MLIGKPAAPKIGPRKRLRMSKSREPKQKVLAA